MNKVFAILPCYNEELNIGALIDEWNLQKEELYNNGYELFVVGIDDCSKDDTKNVILQKVEQYDNVILESHETNKGLCGGLNTAISYFIKHGTQKDLMVLMDGDNTHNPSYIHSMISKISKEKNCIIASRYCKDSGVVGVASHRLFMSDMAKYYYSFVLKVPGVKDYTCGYRLYTFDIINKLVAEFGEDPIIEKSFACMMELLYKLHMVGCNFDEVGFELRYDYKLGASKMQVLKTMKKSISTAITLKRMYNSRSKR